MLVLVTGGASSGKSSYAESVAMGLPGPRYYLAAMKPYGAEGAARIARHRQLRAGKGFTTVECHDGWEGLPCPAPAEGGGRRGTALLECLGNVVANELFGDGGRPAAEEDALQAVLRDVALVRRAFQGVVIVSDEVGADGRRYDETTETYIRVLGAASCALAEASDAVVECIVGQPVLVKGDALPPVAHESAPGTAREM